MRRCGFGTGALLRHHFARTLGTTPPAYRRQFTTVRDAPQEDLQDAPLPA